MKLQEFKDKNGNKINLSQSPASSTSSASNSGSMTSGSFKKRLDKLIKYYGQHLPKNIDYITVNLLTKDTLDFTEHFSDYTTIRFNIYIGPATEAWRLKYYVNNKLIDDNAGTGWQELLKTLYLGYIDELPVIGTQEYKDLLTEWVDKNGNKININSQSTTQTSSGSYKKRFEKLIKYHIDHASSELESVTTKDIKPYGFHLGEHYNTGKEEFDRDIVASVDKNTGTLTFSVFVDGKEVCRRQCQDYEEFVNELGDSYLYVTTLKGTPDYDDLLTESNSIADDFKLYENLWD